MTADMNDRAGRSEASENQCEACTRDLGQWLEGDLDAAASQRVEAHLASCIDCAGLVQALDAPADRIDAFAVLTPSRDLWDGIASQLDAPVLPIGNSAARPVVGRSADRWRMAIAASVLVAATAAVTSVVTWRMASNAAQSNAGPQVAAKSQSPMARDSASRDGAGTTVATSQLALVPDTGAPPTGAAPVTGASSSSGTPERASVSLVLSTASPTKATSMADVDRIYEREIAALRIIVQQRFSELDSTTVSQLQANFRTIDRAIDDSRRALRNDPHSAGIGAELDRTLEAKLELMRRVALL